ATAMVSLSFWGALDMVFLLECSFFYFRIFSDFSSGWRIPAWAVRKRTRSFESGHIAGDEYQKMLDFAGFDLVNNVLSLDVEYELKLKHEVRL
ncbi:MAG: hypothetical protein ACRD3K_08540, partial [Edaphobacter sp.]